MVTPNQALQQTGHATNGFSCFDGPRRVSRLLSWVFGRSIGLVVARFTGEVYYLSRISLSNPSGSLVMTTSYTAVIQQDGEWWIGWVEEVPGVNSQGQSREELLDNLRDALEEALEMNRAEARAAAGGSYEEVSIQT